MSPTPHAIGPYRIIRVLGAGGMGEVFLAEDPRLQRFVALKRLVSHSPSGTPLEADMLRAEARAAARLNHPHIASVYDVIESDQGPCLVMEYVEGETLARLMQGGPLSRHDATRFALQLAEALGAAHAHGVIHRDVKPANIQITPAGSIKLLDLGIARITATQAETTMTASAQQTGEVLGTPAYMAPEQRNLSRIGPFSDVYSAGLVMLEMFTGRPLTSDVDSLIDAAPAYLRAVLGRAAARNPAQRYRDGGELHAALSAAIASATAPQATGPRRTLALGKSFVLAALLALTTGTALWTVARLNRPTATPDRLALAVLPVLNLSADESTGQLASGLTSLLVHNLAAIPNAVIVSGASSEQLRAETRDVQSAAAGLGITHLLDVTLQRRPSGEYRADVALRDLAGVDTWRARYEGDILAVQRMLFGEFDDALLERGLIARRLQGTALERFERLPTNNVEAFHHYSTARGILGRPNAAARSPEAIAAFEQAIREEPAFALAHAGLSDAYRGEYVRTRNADWLDKARQAAEAALAIDPTIAQAHYSLANVRNATGDREGAIQSLRTAIALQTAYEEAHRVLGTLLFDRGDIDESIQEVQYALKLRPDSWNSHYTLGFIYYSVGRHDEAVPHLKRVTELQPEYAAAYTLLGAIRHRQGELTEAIGYYEHATRVGGSASAWTNLGKIYYDAGRFRESLDASLKAVALDERSAAVHRNAGDAYARLDETARASEMYETAIALAARQLDANPRDADLLALVALCEAKLGRADAAVRRIGQAVVLAPDNRDVRHKEAAVFALLAEPQRALAALRNAIDKGLEPELARTDDDLRSLRDVPEFRQMVAASNPRGQS